MARILVLEMFSCAGNTQSTIHNLANIVFGANNFMDADMARLNLTRIANYIDRTIHPDIISALNSALSLHTDLVDSICKTFSKFNDNSDRMVAIEMLNQQMLSDTPFSESQLDTIFVHMLAVIIKLDYEARTMQRLLPETVQENDRIARQFLSCPYFQERIQVVINRTYNNIYDFKFKHYKLRDGITIWADADNNLDMLVATVSIGEVLLENPNNLSLVDLQMAEKFSSLMFNSMARL